MKTFLEDMVDGAIEGAVTLGSAASGVTMAASWIGGCAAGFYEGYMTSKTGQPHCSLTLATASAASLAGMVLSGCQSYDTIGTFETEVIPSAIGCFSGPALCYLGGLVAGKVI
ncbi:MAG: hypothetical protein WCI72_02565 [archaeon]